VVVSSKLGEHFRVRTGQANGITSIDIDIRRIMARQDDQDGWNSPPPISVIIVLDVSFLSDFASAHGLFPGILEWPLKSEREVSIRSSQVNDYTFAIVGHAIQGIFVCL
jgi:hypothetical protein